MSGNKKYIIGYILLGVGVIIAIVYAFLPEKNKENDNHASQTNITVTISQTEKNNITSVIHNFIHDSTSLGYHFESESWEYLWDTINNKKNFTSYYDSYEKVKKHLAFGSPLYSIANNKKMAQHDIALKEQGMEQKISNISLKIPDTGIKFNSGDIEVVVHGTLDAEKTSYFYLGTGEGNPTDFEKTKSTLPQSSFDIYIRKIDNIWKVYDMKTKDEELYSFYDYSHPSSTQWVDEQPIRIPQ